MQISTIVLAAAGVLVASAGLARAQGSPYGPHRSWWDQVEKAQTCAMQPGNPYAYSLQSPCYSTPPAAFADAQRAYPGYYGYPAYGYGSAYPPYGYRYGWGY